MNGKTGSWIGLSFVFFLALAAVTYVSHRLVEDQDQLLTPTMVAVALVPFFILLVLSGKLEKFAGFGLEFGFRSEATKPVTVDAEDVKIDMEPEDRCGHRRTWTPIPTNVDTWVFGAERGPALAKCPR